MVTIGRMKSVIALVLCLTASLLISPSKATASILNASGASGAPVVAAAIVAGLGVGTMGLLITDLVVSGVLSKETVARRCILATKPMSARGSIITDCGVAAVWCMAWGAGATAGIMGGVVLPVESEAIEFPFLDHKDAQTVGVLDEELESYESERSDFNQLVQSLVEKMNESDTQEAAMKAGIKFIEAEKHRYSQKTLSAVYKISSHVILAVQ